MRSLLPVWLVLAVVGLPTVGLSVTADSNISEVTVYQDRAVVTRQAQMALPAGQSEVVFERLPQALMNNSLQVAGSAAAPVTILDVSSHQNFVSFEPDARLEKMRRDIEDLEKQWRILTDRTNRIKSQLQALQHQRQSPHPPASPQSFTSVTVGLEPCGQ